MTLALITPPTGSNSLLNHSSSMLHDNLPTNKVAGSSLVFGFFETGSSVDSSTSSEDSSTLRFLESFSSSSESLSESESESEDEDEDEDESESDSDDDDER